MFRTLYEAKEYAHKNHNLALQWDMGKLTITHWRENDNLVQYLIDNLATKSHSWAMRELKSYFGDNQGLSKKIKKVAENMVKEASKPHLGDQQFEQWPQQPLYMQPMGMQMQPMGMPMPPQRGFQMQQKNNGQLCFAKCLVMYREHVLMHHQCRMLGEVVVGADLEIRSFLGKEEEVESFFVFE